ncbi:dodecin family protein [Methanosalsum natronophilum]|uniref:dodecin family protein n=1 Tax=Methanosalsum natronophilum TaxID=768733 RepID=UPI0021687FB1|nr:dodecin family protein [Methanosalsum natronophilum]
METVGTSPDSWEDAVRNAVKEATELPIFKSMNKIRSVNIKEFDVEVNDSNVTEFLCRVEILLE